MEQAVEQHRLESRTFDVKMNHVLSENERLLAQAIDKDIVKTVYCITLEADSQLNHEIFQQENSVLNQNAPSFTQLFELSELKAQSQAKDTVIVKLKEQIKSLRGNGEDSSVKMDMDEIETLNIELEHRVTKLVTENEHLKQTYKQLYDSIKPKRVQSKEQCDALIKQVNIKSGEISDLNAKLQEQGLVIAALKNELRKLKGKAIDNKETVTHSVDPNVSKDNMEPITPKLLNKRTAHSSYIKHTQEEALVLRDIVEHVKANYTSRSTFRVLHFRDGCHPHETSVARSPQQNGVVERRNRTLIEAARTMLIYAKAPLFLWAEAVATACYTQNRSMIRRRHGKTPYELLHDKPPDLSYLHVFGALCYPTNDSENLGKLQPKADIGIFIGYAPTKKAFRIYNRRTRRIIETIHVDFDELTAMASEHSSSGPALHEMTPVSISSGLVPNPSPSTPFVPPSRSDWDLLFQPMFDESLTVDFHHRIIASYS
ncbi:retrovirus-related pol polyprotein from transposon TNT 1-94 [Tanacetum coccineum]|uniref:Retrovirus-related pol polyprotein from transposon TNT 1-94 n=1 Tax=Tanacetum coccineum TaxID=301880 RepID=A0ABQ4X1K1_9ASTR